jgi:hypothetical protein
MDVFFIFKAYNNFHPYVGMGGLWTQKWNLLFYGQICRTEWCVVGGGRYKGGVKREPLQALYIIHGQTYISVLGLYSSNIEMVTIVLIRALC